MVTCSDPSSPGMTNLPFWVTSRATVIALPGVREALTVNEADPPSSMSAPPVMLMVGSLASSSIIVKLAEPEPVTPPWSPVGASAPSCTLTDSSTSSVSSIAVSVSVASVAAPGPPVKVSVLVADAKAIPVAAVSATLKSLPGAPPVKLIGASSASPSTRERESVTVNPAESFVSPSVASLSVEARVTLVASSSAIATSPEPADGEMV